MKLRLLLMLMAGVSQLHAGSLLVLLSSPAQTGAPGATLQYLGTMTNVSATDTIFLNSITSTSASSNLTIDVGPFFVNAPLSLGPGDVTSPFEIFDVAIDPATPDGLISGSTVSIQGGADAATFDDLADVNFDVQVSSPSAAVPEPSLTWLVLICGARFSMRRRHSCRRS
jgi:hypothetical protein